MTTILHAADSAGLLRLVPSLAGFTPRRSLVLLPFSGTRAYGAMRLDLPDSSADAVPYAERAIDLVARVDGTDGVAIVVYVDEAPQQTPDGPVLPRDALVLELLGCADDAGLRVADALCTTSAGWASYLDDVPVLTPHDQRPAPEIPGIGDVAGDQFAGTTLPTADLAEKERVGRALDDLEELLDRDGLLRLSGDENPQAIAALGVLDDAPAFFEAVLETPESLPPFAAAALLWCLNRPLLRDAALTQWATDLRGGRRALGAQFAAADDGIPIPDDVGRVFLGRGAAPDADRLRLALAVVRIAVSAAPRSVRPGAFASAAWLSWALGRASHAAHYLRLAQEIDRDHRLAGLLAEMIDAVGLPEWAFRRGPTE